MRKRASWSAGCLPPGKPESPGPPPGPGGGGPVEEQPPGGRGAGGRPRPGGGGRPRATRVPPPPGLTAGWPDVFKEKPMSSLFACAHQDHVGSFYAASCGDIPVWPALTAETRADVCVIGGGLAGLSTALELARRGHEVVLLEGSRVGWAASGRNGGQIINGYACGLDLFESAVGQADSERLWQWSLEAMDIVHERCEQHAIDCDLHFGYVHAANKPRHLDALATWMRDMDARYGYRLSLIHI